MNKIIIFLLLVIIACNNTNNKSTPDIFINGGFEYLPNKVRSLSIKNVNGKLVQQFDLKEGNSLVNWQVSNAKFGLDSIIKYSGNYSGRITMDSTQLKNGSIGFMYVLIKSEQLLAENIEFRARVKCKLKDSLSHASIFIQQFPNLKKVTIGNYCRNNQDWTETKATFRIDSSGYIGILVGGLISGEGTVWFDDMELYADGKLVSYSPRKSPLNKSEKDWLHKNTFNINGNKVRSSIQNIKVIGIGEETHGAQVLQSTRWDIVKDLIVNNGFTIIAAEMYQYVRCSNINDYVTLKSDILKHNRSSDTEFLEWLREFNKTAKTKVQFIGVEAAPQYLIDIIDKNGKGELKLQCDTLRDIIVPRMNKFRSGIEAAFTTIEFTQQEREVLNRNINDCKRWIELNITDKKEKNEFIFLINLLEDNLKLDSHKRNEMMANIVEHLSIQNPNGHIILIAHNGHVQFGPRHLNSKGTGAHLRKKFGKEYYAIRMTFYDGSYRDSYGGRYSYPAMKGTAEYLFSNITKDSFFLPLRDLKLIDRDSEWLDKPLLHRAIGSTHKNFGYSNYKLREGFDAVVFLKTSKAY